MIKPIVLYKPNDVVTINGKSTLFTIDVVDGAYALLKYMKNGRLKIGDWAHFSDLEMVKT